MQTQREELITVINPKSPIAEAYRALRTNIQFSILDKSLRTMMVTSTSSEEGKSTILANLGVTFAQAGNRVILVDCDLRRPRLHEIFDVDNSTGLTSLFIASASTSKANEAEIDEKALDFGQGNSLRETSIANLKILPSGKTPPNPSELLGSQRMGKIIENLSSQADFVLFDSPPILAVTDAAVLARRVDGVLLVISAGKTKRDRAIKAKAMLEKVSAKVLGVVLNNVRLDNSLYGY